MQKLFLNNAKFRMLRPTKLKTTQISPKLLSVHQPFSLPPFFSSQMFLLVFFFLATPCHTPSWTKKVTMQKKCEVVRPPVDLIKVWEMFSNVGFAQMDNRRTSLSIVCVWAAL